MAPAGKRKTPSFKVADKRDGKKVAKRAQVEESESEEDRFVMSEDDSEGSEAEEEQEEQEEEEDDLSAENSGRQTTKQESHSKDKATKVTGAEVLALNEASLLFKTNLFKLQIQELLKESSVHANSKATRALDAALRQIRDVVTSMDAVKEQSVDAAVNYVYNQSKRVTDDKRGIDVPFPDPAPAVGMSLTLEFQPPTVVNVVGSYALGMVAKTHQGFNVDMVVQMPSELLQERDHLNFRYVYKRAYYVAMLMIGIKQSALGELFEITLGRLRDDVRLPVVELRAKKDVKQIGKLGCVIRVIPTFGHDAMPLKRLMPDRNHVRPGYLTGTPDESDKDLPATPQYNATVLGDALMVTHMKYLHETTSMCPEFAQAAALLRIWISQRNLVGRKIGDQELCGSARINGFVLTMLLAFLVRGVQSGGRSGPKLAGTMSAYQLFKGTIEYLAAHDFSETPVQFGTDADLSVFAEHYAGVFVDPTSSLNLLAGVQAWELEELRLAARRTAFDLNNNGADRFGIVFLSPALCDVAGRYDHVFRLTVNLSKFLSPKHGAQMDGCKRLNDIEWGSPVAAVQQRLASFLGTALAKQARVVAVLPTGGSAFGEGTKAMRTHTFFIGVIADATEARRLVDLGPSPDAQADEAARFRAYWGERAELRRFRDGSIRLATVWGESGMPFEKRAQVLPRMIAYLLRRHFAVRSVPSELLQAEDLAVVDKNRPKNAHTSDNGETAELFSISTSMGRFAQSIDDNGVGTFEEAATAFDELQKEVKEIEDQLPLRVLQLHAVSPGLRYASVVPPKRVDDDDSFIEPQHVLVEFESSSKWPDDITALHKVKAAFLMRLNECYTGKYPEIETHVGNRFFGYGSKDGLVSGMADLKVGDQDNMDYETDNFLDIRHSSGITFRLSVLCEREGEMVAKIAGEMRSAKLTARADALELAHRRWERNNVWRAKHHKRILDLSQRHHPAMSMTMRLLKRWLARHMLLGQTVGMPEEVAELVAAHVFTDVSDGLAAPGTGYTGFVRCLRVLGGWAWKDDLFTVDFAADNRDGAGDDDEDDDDEEAVAMKTLAQGVWVAKGMDADTMGELQSMFEAKKFKGGWRVATEDDPAGMWWGQGTAMLSRRIATLAKASLQCVRESLATGNGAKLDMVFTTPLSDYDFVIKLDKDVVCRRYEQPPKLRSAEDAQGEDAGDAAQPEVFKNLLPTVQQPVGARPRAGVHANPFNQPGMVGFDPVGLYVRDLVNVYHRSALFFHDVYGGHIIAGLWNPAVAAQSAHLNPRAHANVMPGDSKAAKTQALVGFNKDAVVAEIIRLGEGLVADFVLQQD
ncbi:U3 snoRNP protein [Linderina macrospora]|uniref:U3 snoRNP protein n=1 Tax=Linderina macrospora TaxID=4868 RepID=A0ACC1JFL4_9FUNG|nr:U3 snoRNP protein [Linderina macrospora]